MDEQLAAANLDRKQVERLIRRIERLAEDVRRMHLSIYAANGEACLVHDSHPHHDQDACADRTAVIADLGWGWGDGGDW